VAATAAVVAGITASAGASPSSSTSTVSPALVAQADAAITERLDDLQGAATLVRQTSWLTPGDASALLAIINGEISGSSGEIGLTALKAQIDATTNPSTLRSDIASIYSGYRVYALVLPQVHLVRVADLITGDVIGSLQQSVTTLQTAITTEKADGQDTSAAQAAVNDLSAQITAISSDTNGVAAAVLRLTPAEWDANHAVLSGPRSSLGAAAAALSKARTDIAAALRALR
jgi:hypothetical protein